MAAVFRINAVALMELDTVVRVVLRMAVIDVHRATSDTTNPLILAIRTNAVA